MNICMCGAENGYPHNEFCPWPYFGNIQSKQAYTWQTEWEKRRTEARKTRVPDGPGGCCKRPLIDDDCMWPVCDLYVPPAKGKE